MQYVDTSIFELYPSFICTLFYRIFFFKFWCISDFSFYGKPVWFFVYVIIYCVAAGITTLMFVCDGLDPKFFRR